MSIYWIGALITAGYVLAAFVEDDPEGDLPFWDQLKEVGLVLFLALLWPFVWGVWIRLTYKEIMDGPKVNIDKPNSAPKVSPMPDEPTSTNS